jgi:hypothetical protein
MEEAFEVRGKINSAKRLKQNNQEKTIGLLI